MQGKLVSCTEGTQLLTEYHQLLKGGIQRRKELGPCPKNKRDLELIHWHAHYEALPKLDFLKRRYYSRANPCTTFSPMFY